MNFINPTGCKEMINLDQIAYITNDDTTDRQYKIVFANGICLDKISQNVYDQITGAIIKNNGMISDK